jgi:hypothetical protein
MYRPGEINKCDPCDDDRRGYQWYRVVSYAEVPGRSNTDLSSQWQPYLKILSRAPDRDLGRAKRPRGYRICDTAVWWLLYIILYVSSLKDNIPTSSTACQLKSRGSVSPSPFVTLHIYHTHICIIAQILSQIRTLQVSFPGTVSIPLY